MNRKNINRLKKTDATAFIEQIAALRFDNAFNPYAQTCPVHDGNGAAEIRRQNLQLVLDAALRIGIDSVWIARDLGYRGGRRTGLALTDEAHLECHSAMYGGLPLARSTKGPLVAERTATVVWKMLRDIDRPIFLWNVFPLHPHAPGDPMSNRCHTRKERIACLPLLTWLLTNLQPKRVVAIGRDAQAALVDAGIVPFNLRHPSYGGQSEFVSGLSELYDIPVLDTGSSAQTCLI